ncbi:phosphate ABC transporter permease subunit PstC, partial [Acinetobacter baumannii]
VKIVIPSALSGIVASFILALSRAVGEVMAVTIAAGARPTLTLNPGEEVQTMTSYIVNVSRGDAPRGTMAYNTIFAVG